MFSRESMYLAALAACESAQDRVGPKLLNFFPSAEAVWHAPAELLLRADLSPEIVEKFIWERKKIEPERMAESCEKTGCAIVSRNDLDYPPLLKQITFPPPVLFVRGKLNLVDQPTLAVVGTRKSTAYGQRVIEDMIAPLARAGVVIISGLAYGCDTTAHAVTISSGGRTVAVLGGGIDDATIYPSANRILANKIIQQNGAVLSAYPPTSEPKKHTFPQRNRIIAGIAQGTLVIEAPEESGALITARHALEENREVLAVPGSIYEPNAQGTNGLISQGARCVRSVDDILDALALSAVLVRPPVTTPRTNPREQAILDALKKEPYHADALISALGLPAQEILGCISCLELEGLIARTADGRLRIKT